MRVAICDDLQEAIEDLKEKLTHFPEITSVDTFTNLKDFAKHLEKNKYDICFMDIVWGKDVPDGIEFAECLKGVSIVFVTAYPLDYAEKIFSRNYTPSGFLMKPAKEEQIEVLLGKIKKERSLRLQTVTFTVSGKVQVVKATDIIYLEGILHKTRVFLHNGSEMDVNKSLAEISQSLPGYFLFCHKSFVVNPRYVASLTADKITLKNKTVIPVSRAKSVDTKERFMTYLSK